MPEIIELDLLGERLLSRNQLDKMHWRARHRLSKRIKRDIGYLVLASRRKKLGNPFGRAAVSITSYRKQLLDPDNLTGGIKPYLDALVTNRVLANDTPANVELTVHQIKSKNYAVEIRINPL